MSNDNRTTTSIDARTIERSQWPSFLDQFTRENRGAHASLEILNQDLGDQFEIEDRPFQGVSADLKDNEDTVWMMFGETPEDRVSHSIRNVQAIRLIPPSSDRGAILEVEGRGEALTILHLSLPGELALPPG